MTDTTAANALLRRAEGVQDELLVVKENQPTPRHDLATLFASRADAALRAASLPAGDMRRVTRVESGATGATSGAPSLSSAELNDYLDWPGVAQVCRVERTWRYAIW